jgi:peptidoglycan/xylan/chitin deacetylase (PgdA/CDA1 family)
MRRRFIILLAASAAALASGPSSAPPASAEGPPPVVVSLQFDDGTADHEQAAAILDGHDLDGTFFVNSSRTGQPGFLTWGGIAALASAGHEIGGHTLTHQNLTTLPEAEQLREACDDRSALLARGHRVTSLAYPFGATSQAAADVLRECGYTSGRRTSGIASAGGCGGCPRAETLPPADPFATRIPQSVRATTTLADIQGYVNAARDHGGGWIQVAMHRICEACSEFAITAERLEALAAWLAAERDAGRVVVQTVDAVIGGPLLPAVAGPPPPPPVGGSNGLVNPGFEDDTNADGTPDCWSRAVFGTSTATWSRIPEGIGGSWADRVEVSSIASGARRLLVRQDNGTCAPTVRPGRRYEVAASYRGDAVPRFVAYRRLAGGFWTYWAQSGDRPAAADWRREAWVTPEVPADTTALSVGLSVAGTGTLTMDDLALRDANPAPVVTLDEPTANSALAGVRYIRATATDDEGIARVRFLLDGVQLGTRTVTPYRWKWNTATVPDGPHTLQVIAEDVTGNATASAIVPVLVVNSGDPVIVSLLEPASGATVSGASVYLRAAPFAPLGVVRVRFFLDGVQLGTRTAEPWRWKWDSRTVPDGVHLVRAVAEDPLGRTAATADIPVTVANG